MIMIWLALASAVTLVLYLWIMWRLHGIQPSISDNYYVSRHPSVFTIVFWIISFTMTPAMIESVPDSWKLAGFMAGTAIAFVGAAASFKEELVRQVHIGAAFTAGTGAMIWAFLLFPILPILAVIVMAVLMIRKPAHKVYWIEITAFTTTYLTYFITRFI